MTKDTSVSFARTSISLASVCLALLSASIPASGGVLLHLPIQLRVLISIIGAFLLLSAALMIDWSIDLLTDDDWKKLDDLAKSLGDPLFDSHRSFKARMRLFGGGYLLLSIGMGVLMFTMLYLLIVHAGVSHPTITVLSVSSSGVSGVAVFIKMMTRKLGTVAKTILFIGGFAFVSVAMNIYLLRS